MPESSPSYTAFFGPTRSLLEHRSDALWLTVVWMATAAAAWWAVQPGMLVPDDWNGWPEIVWVILVVRGGLGAKRGWVAFLIGWLCFIPAWLITLAWIGDISVAGWPSLAIYSAFYPPTMVVLIRWLSTCHRLPMVLVGGVVGVSLEYVRAEVLFDSWPFHLIGSGMSGGSNALLAQWGGLWLVTLVVMFTGVLCVNSLIWGFFTKYDGVVVVLLIGTSFLPLPAGPIEAAPLRVLAVQTNLPQSNKMGWSHEQQAKDLAHFEALTMAGLSEAGDVDLVVWPETMVPGLGFDPDTMALLDQLGPRVEPWRRGSLLLQQAADQTGVPWLVGSPTWTGVTIVEDRLEPTHRYNSAVLVEPDGSVERYDKIFLTPFGETMPYARNWKWIEESVMDFGAAGMRFNLDVGVGPQLLDVSNDTGQWSIAVPICFEDAVPSVVRELAVVDGVTQADVLINISNDGWFGGSDAGRQSHEQAAIWRALELGRPMLRVANTGITSLLLPDGSVAGALEPRTDGTLVVEIPRYEGTTLYARWGNWLPRLCLLLLLAGSVVRYVLGPDEPQSKTDLSSAA